MNLQKTLAIAFIIFSTAVHANDRLGDFIDKMKFDLINHGMSYEDLREITTEVGPRPSGSLNAERAVAWGEARMKSAGLDRVWLQPVLVPYWERGNQESAKILTSAGEFDLAVAALGRSAGTEKLIAEVIEVKSLEEVRTLGEAVRGKIVFYNRPMEASLEDTFEAYSRAVDQRSSGPNLASKLGAVGVLVRSMTTLDDNEYPHTGATNFQSGVTPIPAAALSTRSANLLSEKLKIDSKLKVQMTLSAQTFPSVISHNVIGEITGSELPHEIVLMGAHLDSWDLGQGAHDDGVGVAQTIDICRMIKKSGMRPKRTIRCVLFMAEELGGIGGKEYAKVAIENKEVHVMAVESDRGGFAPEKFSVDGSEEEISELNQKLNYFADTGVREIYQGGAGTDVEPLAATGTLTMELVPNSKHYFDYHHAGNDLFGAVDEQELKQGAAALATMVLIYSEK